MGIPYSDKKLVNDARPTTCNVVTDLPPYIRENRQAINHIWSAIPTNCGYIELPTGENIINVGGYARVTLGVAGGDTSVVTKINTGTEAPGRMVVLKVSDTMPGKSVTFKHSDANGIWTQDRKDLVLGAGDHVVFHYCDAAALGELPSCCAAAIDKVWFEVARSVARWRPDMTIRNVVEFDDYQALVVRDVTSLLETA